MLNSQNFGVSKNPTSKNTEEIDEDEVLIIEDDDTESEMMVNDPRVLSNQSITPYDPERLLRDYLKLKLGLKDRHCKLFSSRSENNGYIMTCRVYKDGKSMVATGRHQADLNIALNIACINMLGQLLPSTSWEQCVSHVKDLKKSQFIPCNQICID